MKCSAESGAQASWDQGGGKEELHDRHLNTFWSVSASACIPDERGASIDVNAFITKAQSICAAS